MTADLTDCPPGHVAYLSPYLAANAVTLHTLAYPHCPGIESFRCGDHWHIGHPHPHDGNRCKSDPDHVATRDRIRHGNRRPSPTRPKRVTLEP